MKPLIACLLFLAILSTASAQHFTVDAGDPAADYQDLQVALDSVPAGSTLLLRSSFVAPAGGDFRISRAVSLVGDGPGSGQVSIFGYTWMEGYTYDVRALRVTFDARGSGGWAAFETSKACQLHFDQCQFWSDYTDSHGAVAWDHTVATYTNCIFSGPDYSSLLGTAMTSWVSPDGAVILKDCVLQTHSGMAGEVLSGSLIYHTNTAILGDVFGQTTALPDTLDLRDWTLAVGSTVSLTARGTPLGPSVLVFSFEYPQAPVALSGGWWFLQAPFTALAGAYDGTGEWALQSALPADPSLIGQHVSLQAWDATANLLSGLEAGLIRP